MNFAELEKKVASYTGPKIGFVLTGGGIGVAQLATVVGASKLIHSITIPYSSEESERFIREGLSVVKNDRRAIERSKAYAKHAVSEHAAELLALVGDKLWSGFQDDPCGTVVCTAATTTSRYRRGDNHAWIGIVRPGGPWFDQRVTFHHLKLSKLSEEEYNKAGAGYIAWKRRDEDRQITEFILNQVFEVLGKY